VKVWVRKKTVYYIISILKARFEKRLKNKKAPTTEVEVLL